MASFTIWLAGVAGLGVCCNVVEVVVDWVTVAVVRGVGGTMKSLGSQAAVVYPCQLSGEDMGGREGRELWDLLSPRGVDMTGLMDGHIAVWTSGCC